MTEITKYPLFGKSKLTKDILSDEIGFDKGHCICFPAISPGKATESGVTVYNDLPVRPFSNGSEFDSWTCSNCEKCKKQEPQVSIPTDLRVGGCALEFRLSIGYIDDGTIPFKTAKRIGIKGLAIQKNGSFVHLTKCKEFEPK